MRILITGGAGFIGSHLARRLLAERHEVIVIDNESVGRRENVPSAAFYSLGDVTRPRDLVPLFDKGLDAVCHIAGQVSIVRSFTNPIADLRTNVEGTINVLQQCVAHRVPRLLYASSMTIYGNCQRVPTPETEPCCPDSYYGITKLAAERYVHATAERPDLGYDFHATSLRMYSVYGPGQPIDNPYQGVLGIFLGNVLRDEPITICGDGEQTRDFVYIGDIVDGWVRALSEPRSYGRAINLGSGRSTSINQLARHAIESLGGSPATYPFHRVAARPGEQRAVQADIECAGSLLGWQPRVDFSMGLKETARWSRSAGARQPVAPRGQGGAR